LSDEENLPLKILKAIPDKEFGPLRMLPNID
jgi:hypothetical protein